MRKNSLFLLAVFIGLIQSAAAQKTVLSSDGVTVNVENTTRIITIGGSITETVYALGFGKNVIATDASSTFPREVFSLPRVPYVRNLTSEGILSLSPTLILSSDDANPASAIQQIRDAGTPLLLIEENETLEGVNRKITTIGKALGAESEAQALVDENTLKYKKAESVRTTLDKTPAVMFVLAVRGSSSFMVAGNNTGAQTMIELAGGKNALTGFDGYKQATLESIVAANPDYVLMMQSRYDEISSGLKKTPVINTIAAVKKNHLIGMDGNFLLGFGPRFGNAILNLMSQIHPGLEIKL